MCDNPYIVLNVSEKDPIETIKRAYRKLSLIYHPDKNKDPAATHMFHKITEAFHKISNDNGRNIIVDKTKPPDDKTMCVRPNDTTEYVDIHIYGQVDITLIQAYHGIVVPMTIQREVRIGDKIRTEDVTIYVDIHPGIDNNEIVICENMGNVIQSTTYGKDIHGNAKIRINVVNDTPFIRKGLDLIYKKDITLYDALNGINIVIPHIDGREIGVKTKPNMIIEQVTRQSIKNYGMVRGTYKGDLVVELIVKFPVEISDTALSELNSVLKRHDIK